MGVNVDAGDGGEVEVEAEVMADMLLDFRTRRRRWGRDVRGWRLDRVVRRFSSRERSVMAELRLCGGREV